MPGVAPAASYAAGGSVGSRYSHPAPVLNTITRSPAVS
jgi:hypothetical protein